MIIHWSPVKARSSGGRSPTVSVYALDYRMVERVVVDGWTIGGHEYRYWLLPLLAARETVNSCCAFEWIASVGLVPRPLAGIATRKYNCPSSSEEIMLPWKSCELERLSKKFSLWSNEECLEWFFSTSELKWFYPCKGYSNQWFRVVLLHRPPSVSVDLGEIYRRLNMWSQE